MNIVTIDPSKHEVMAGSRNVELTPKEYAILMHMAQVKGAVVSRQHLLDTHWTKRQTQVDSRTVDQHIARIRRGLGKDSTCVVTVTNFGYRTVGVTIKNGEDKIPRGKITMIHREYGKNPLSIITVRIPGAAASLVEGATVALS